MRFPTAVLTKVIIFSVVCLLFTVALAVRLSNKNFLSGYKSYEAEFTNALGVLRGDSVKVAGVDVGRVTDIAIEDGKALVSFEIEDSVELPADTRAAVRWRNVLGQRFIYLFPGTDTEPMGEGDRIPVARTEEAGDIGALLNNLGPILRAIDPEKANAFLESVNTALSGNEIAARQLIHGGSILAEDLAAMDEEIKTLVDSSDKVVGAFAEQDEDLKAILEHLNSVGGALEASTGDINTVITDFAAVQRHLNGLLERNGRVLDATIANAEAVTGVLARERKNLARTLCTVPMGLAGYFQTSSWGEWFNVRIYEVVIRDSNGETISDTTELPQQRGAKPPPAVDGCGSLYDRSGSRNHAGGGGGTPGLPTSGTSEGADAIVRFVLEGGEDA